MNQLQLKVLYLRSILLLDEIKYYDAQLRSNSSTINQFRIIRLCFTPLYTFLDSLRHYNIWLADKNELLSEKREIAKKLEFARHIRNKIGGHLDEVVIQKATEWEPSIFAECVIEKTDIQLILCYKSLIESAINSFLDNNEIQKNFGAEIDLFYPPNNKQFLEYLERTNTGCIKFLEKVIASLNKEIKYHTAKEAVLLNVKAGATDFRL